VAIINARTGYLNGTTDGWAAKSLFEAGGALYAVVLNTSASLIEVHKSIDGGSSWTEQDSGNSRSHSGATHSYGAEISGTTIYVAYRTSTNTLRVRGFDTATDTWAGADVGAADASTVAAATHNVRVNIRSDGDIVVQYRNSGTQDSTYTRYEGSSWTEVTYWSTNTSWPVSSILGDSDLIHQFVRDATTTNLVHKTLTSANGSGTATGSPTTVAAQFSQFGGMVNDGGTIRIALAVTDSTGELDFEHAASTTDPTFTLVSNLSPTSTSDPGLLGGVVVPYSGEWYVIWSGDGRGSIHMDHGGTYASPSFGTDTDVITGLGNDPAVYAIATATGIPVLYTNPTGPSVDLIWAVGSGGAGPVTVSVPVSTATSAALAPTVTGGGANTVRSFAVLIG